MNKQTNETEQGAETNSHVQKAKGTERTRNRLSQDFHPHIPYRTEETTQGNRKEWSFRKWRWVDWMSTREKSQSTSIIYRSQFRMDGKVKQSFQKMV